MHTGLRQGPLSDVPRGLRPRTPKSIFHHFSSISLSAIQFNGRDSETGPISAPHSAVLKRFRKQLGAPNFGGQFRGRKRQRLQSFEVLRPIVSERETSHSPTNRVAVWWTCGPFFDLLTPKRGGRITKLFHPLEGTITMLKWRTRVNRTFLSRVHKVTMVNPFK